MGQGTRAEEELEARRERRGQGGGAQGSLREAVDEQLQMRSSSPLVRTGGGKGECSGAGGEGETRRPDERR